MIVFPSGFIGTSFESRFEDLDLTGFHLLFREGCDALASGESGEDMVGEEEVDVTLAPGCDSYLMKSLIFAPANKSPKGWLHRNAPETLKPIQAILLEYQYQYQ